MGGPGKLLQEKTNKIVLNSPPPNHRGHDSHSILIAGIPRRHAPFTDSKQILKHLYTGGMIEEPFISPDTSRIHNVAKKKSTIS